ncbi:DUF418 domain-containing protein [Rummeliibacillus sp. NPDC094406]|uniref:DUF418 domain-containing protein n=1 Tax=Rummeliibacillus sp. NPDC094406 TaxID=3364511 RepID=UPI0038054D22
MNSIPTTSKQRIDTLDILRGVSLLGILLVNMFAFSTPLPHIDLKTWFTVPADKEFQKWLDIFVQGSFYPLFSMLFGYGLAMQYSKASRLGESFYKIGIKRLIVLFVIGILHAFFIWWGDILMTYAFCGFVVIALIRLRPGFLLAIGLIFYTGINGLMALLTGLSTLVDPSSSDMSQFIDIEGVQGALKAYGAGSWTEAFTQRLTDLSVQFSPYMWVMALFTILPYMLIGAAASKWQLIEKAKSKMVLWGILMIIMIPLGISLKSLTYTLHRNVFLDYIQSYFGGPILALGYASLVVLVCCIPHATKVLSPIAKAGRMSMTIYLMQSVIGTFIFYHYGLGLYGKIGVDTATWLAVGIYVIQLVFATIWFMQFKQGPVEAVWKRITYGKTVLKKEEINH